MKQPISKLLVGEEATEKELSGYSNCEIKDLLLGKEITAQTELGKALIENKSSGGSSEGGSEPFDINNIIFPSLNSVISRASNHAKFAKMSMNLDPVYSTDHRQYFGIPKDLDYAVRAVLGNIQTNLNSTDTKTKVLALYELLAWYEAAIPLLNKDPDYDFSAFEEKRTSLLEKFNSYNGYLKNATVANIVVEIINEQHAFHNESYDTFVVVFDEELTEFIKMFYEDE